MFVHGPVAKRTQDITKELSLAFWACEFVALDGGHQFIVMREALSSLHARDC